MFLATNDGGTDILHLKQCSALRSLLKTCILSIIVASEAHADTWMETLQTMRFQSSLTQDLLLACILQRVHIQIQNTAFRSSRRLLN